MEFTILGIGILTWITFLPVLGMVVVLLLPKGSNNAIRWTSLGVTVMQVILAVIIFARFDRTMAGMQFVEKGSWIDIKSVAWFGRVHIEYFLGIDGISVVMVHPDCAHLLHRDHLVMDHREVAEGILRPVSASGYRA